MSLHVTALAGLYGRAKYGRTHLVKGNVRSRKLVVDDTLGLPLEGLVQDLQVLLRGRLEAARQEPESY